MHHPADRQARLDLAAIAGLAGLAPELSSMRVLDTVTTLQGETLPIHALTIGCADLGAPTLALTGGVHGLERIGSQVVVAFLRSLLQELRWNEGLRARFRTLRVVAVPLVNPGGYLARTRANPRGVDLMRNAPVDADRTSRFGLVGGHRLSPRLPWYRGVLGAPMEREAQAVTAWIESEVFASERALLVDCHSGFGFRDRLWYPYARTQSPFPRVREALALARSLTETFPQHGYVIEPQSASYTTHGDLLDHLFDRHAARPGAGLFLPWTLEMGSWRWLARRPWHALSPLAWFNPIDAHAHARVLRQHLLLFRFLLDHLNPAQSHGAARDGPH